MKKHLLHRTDILAGHWVSVILLLLCIASAVEAADPTPKVINEPLYMHGCKIDFDAIFIPSPPIVPMYPDEAIAARKGALVWIKAKIKRSGDVAEAKVAFASDTLYGFREVALAAVTGAKFKPSVHEKTAFIPFHFVLDSLGESAGRPPADSKAIEVPPKMIYEKNPKYPALAKDAQIEGVVWVEALVDSSGIVRDVRIWKSSGAPSLDMAALKAAWDCRFSPATQDEKRIAVWVTFNYSFRLRGH